jgi:hypothetical protein
MTHASAHESSMSDTYRQNLQIYRRRDAASLPRALIPIERASLPSVNQADRQDTDIDQHFDEAEHAELP